MYPFNKPLLEVTEQDITSLTEEENLRLDYKGDLSKGGGAKGEWKDELRKDVTAFANTAGGTLIIGVHEKNKAPISFPGAEFFAGKTTDSIEREVSNALAVRVEPRLPGPAVRAIPISGTDRHFVVVQMPGRSWAAPHWVELEEMPGQTRGVSLWHRVGTINRPMGYGEAERAFRDRFLGQRALEGFRQERLAVIGSGAFGENSGALVLHIVPYSAVDGMSIPDLSPFDDFHGEFSRFASCWFNVSQKAYHETFYDFQGFGCLYRDQFRGNEAVHGWARIYRNGATELVDTRQLRGHQIFTVPWALESIEGSVEFQIQLLESLEISGPYEVFFSLLNVENKGTDKGTLMEHAYLFPGIRVTSRATAREELSALRIHISHTAGYAKPREFGAKIEYPQLPTPWREPCSD